MNHKELITTIEEITKSDRTFEYRIKKIRSVIELFKQEKDNLVTIKQIVAEYHNLKESDLSIKTRKREIVEARQIAMYFYDRYTSFNDKEIGNEFSILGHSFDRTTVIHTIQTVKNIKQTNRIYRDKIDEIEQEIIKYYKPNDKQEKNNS